MPGAAISAQDIVDAQAGRKYYYMWGWLYTGIRFRGTPVHLTYYNWMLVFNGDPMQFMPHTCWQAAHPGVMEINYIVPGEGNVMDPQE